MERACCPRVWWTSRATSRRARWWRWWETAGNSRGGSSTSTRASCADLERARTRGLTRAFLDRLTLSEARIEEMANGLRQIAALPDPVGTVAESWRRPNGIEISRVRVPLGVIAFIYESRPNVTADAAGLCVKSGNAVLLRGGSEAIESNTLIAAVLGKAP